jgi:hypothetical protein
MITLGSYNFRNKNRILGRNQNLIRKELINIPEITLENFILKHNIRQIRTSNSLYTFSLRVKEKYKLDDYKDSYKNTIFFGIYDKKDYLSILNHKSNAYIMPGGSDTNRCKYITNIPNIATFISISKDIQNRLNKLNITSIFVKFNLVNKTIFKPVSKPGNKIFIYNGIIKKIHNEITYGKKYYDEVCKMLPNYEYIFSSDLNLPYEKMPEIYSQCFIGLRLTMNDGNANTVQEMESMNIPIIHNQSDYGLKWKNVKDIVNYIIQYTPRNSAILIDNYKCINVENVNSYNDLINNSNGDNINEANFIKNVQEKNITIYYNNIFISGNKDLEPEITISRNKKYNQIINKKNVFLSIIPYKSICNGYYFITQSMIDAVKDKTSLLYPHVFDYSLYNSINNKPFLLQEQKINKKWYNWDSDEEIKKLKLKYFKEKSFIICICGRIAINSYPKSLLETIIFLRNQGYDINLLVLGKLIISPERLTSNLYNEINSYNWVKSFTVNKKNILNYFRMCDILASTYRDYCNNVGGSNKIKEYLLCNKPILCSRGKERERELGTNYPGFYDCETCNTVPPLCWTSEYLANPTSYLEQYNKYFKNIDENGSNIEEVNSIKKYILTIINNK